MTRQAFVFGDWPGLATPTRIGQLNADRVHGTETFSFEYDPPWLESLDVALLDPELQFYSGRQYVGDASRANFGLFLDSSPDRWGRMLMQRNEAITARQQQRQPKRLFELDYLLGVHDEQRVGGLRFKGSLDGDYQSDESKAQVPPWARLRELEQAAWLVQHDELEDDRHTNESIRLLLAPGSSIGGARPKAGVCDENLQLWIAKFPGRNDEHDVGAWEMVAYRLAAASGIQVSDARLAKFGKSQHTFLVQRFDRTVVEGCRLRIHFASAMTMLGYNDGTSFQDGASYLEIVEFLMQHGARVDDDLKELWRRIVFSICVSNTDDHLRNHGFLLRPTGWQLSPAYDLNPNPAGTGLHLNISEVDNSLSLELAVSVAEYFRLTKSEARHIAAHITAVVRTWQDVASDIGISRAAQERMRPAFQVAAAYL